MEHFTDNQLTQLVKVAETLPRDQQKILVQVLSDKINNTKRSSRSPHKTTNNYQHHHYRTLYNQLMDAFKKAKQRMTPMIAGKTGNGAVPKTLAEEDQQRLKQQQEELQLMLRNHN